MFNNLKGIFILLYVLIHKFVERLYAFFIKLLYPVDDSVIILRSMPDYSDNARALSDYMLENGYTEKYKIYFDVDNLSNYKNRIEGITFISSKTKIGFSIKTKIGFSSKAKIRCYRLSYLRLLLTAKYLLSTHELIIRRNIARKEQCIIRLWHGCGYKTRKQPKGKIVKIFDAALVPGPLFVKIKAQFWNVDEKYILPIGYPRYDWLRQKDNSAKRLIDTFKKNEYTKIVMWMPTFRNDKNQRFVYSNNITQFPLISNIDSWNELDRFCKDNNVAIIIKLHPFQENYPIPFDSFSSIHSISNDVFDKMDIPMYKFVGLTDALISDYSSIAIDYLLVNHPIAYTLDFFEEDIKTRKFIFDDPRKYMPGHHLYNFENLKSFVHDVSIGVDPYKPQREQLCKKAINPSENYCESILTQLGILK